MCVCETLFLSFLSRRLFRFPIGVCLVQVQGAYVYLAGQQLTEEFFSTMQAHHSKEMIKKLFFQKNLLPVIYCWLTDHHYDLPLSRAV